jgi:hypothetical protein
MDERPSTQPVRAGISRKETGTLSLVGREKGVGEAGK